MAKPNYGFEKRQRELAKKKQQEEKRLKKQRTKSEDAPPSETDSAQSTPAATPEGEKLKAES